MAGRGPETPDYRDCPVRNERGCDWDGFFEGGEREGAVCEQLHLLTKHPEDYRILTGNDPEKKLVEYADAIKLWRNVL